MHPPIPTEARLAARVIVIDPHDRVLLFRAEEPFSRHPFSRHPFWLMPGGGLEPGETFEQAAQRELFEETGLTTPIGPCVWHRRHRHQWNGREADQFEMFFLTRVGSHHHIAGANLDSYMKDHRWWTIAELQHSTDDFAPRRLAELLPPLLKHEIPTEPIDCGV